MKLNRLIQIEMTNRCVDEKGRLIVGKAFSGKKSKVTTYENPKTHKKFAVVSSLDDNPVDDLFDELDTSEDELGASDPNDEFENGAHKLEQAAKSFEECCDCLHDIDPVAERECKYFANRIAMACQIMLLSHGIDKLDYENDRLQKEKEAKCQTK